MDVDDDPSPVDLEQLLPLSSEDDLPKDVPQHDEFDQEFLSNKFTELLAAVPENDPLMRPMSCKPCFPRLGSKYQYD